MVETPWGAAGDLRGRKLNPGLRVPRDEVERSQRERLFGALVACCADRGHSATSVGDLLAMSGVSRATFYELFVDKDACLAAAIEELVLIGIGLAKRSYDTTEGDWRDRSAAAMRTILQLMAEQPAAARMCIVEASAGGAEAMAPLPRALEAVEGTALEMLAEVWGGDRMPPAVVRAVIAGLHRLAYRYLYEERQQELADRAGEVLDWMLSYEPPPGPLRGRSRRAPAVEGASLAAQLPSQRIVRGLAAAVGERGYLNTTVADITAAARVSQQTFYAHFQDKQDATKAALESSGAQILAAALPLIRRADEWTQAIHSAIEAAFSYLAAEPDFAQLRTQETFAAGPWAVTVLDEAQGTLLTEAMAIGGDPPQVSKVVTTATMGAVMGVAAERVRSLGPASLVEAVPLATYVALAPLIGGPSAYEVACA